MKEDMRYMQGYSSLLSSAFFLWMNWIFKKGYKGTLEMADLGSLSEVHTTKYQRENFLKALKKEEVHHSKILQIRSFFVCVYFVKGINVW